MSEVEKMNVHQPCEDCPKLVLEIEDARHDLIDERERRLVTENLVRALVDLISIRRLERQVALQ